MDLLGLDAMFCAERQQPFVVGKEERQHCGENRRFFGSHAQLVRRDPRILDETCEIDCRTGNERQRLQRECFSVFWCVLSAQTNLPRRGALAIAAYAGRY